jgi:hypothetical protein
MSIEANSVPLDLMEELGRSDPPGVRETLTQKQVDELFPTLPNLPDMIIIGADELIEDLSTLMAKIDWVDGLAIDSKEILPQLETDLCSIPGLSCTLNDNNGDALPDYLQIKPEEEGYFTDFDKVCEELVGSERGANPAICGQEFFGVSNFQERQDRDRSGSIFQLEIVDNMVMVIVPINGRETKLIPLDQFVSTLERNTDVHENYYWVTPTPEPPSRDLIDARQDFARFLFGDYNEGIEDEQLRQERDELANNVVVSVLDQLYPAWLPHYGPDDPTVEQWNEVAETLANQEVDEGENRVGLEVSVNEAGEIEVAIAYMGESLVFSSNELQSALVVYQNETLGEGHGPDTEATLALRPGVELPPTLWELLAKDPEKTIKALAGLSLFVLGSWLMLKVYDAIVKLKNSASEKWQETKDKFSRK